MSDYNHLPAILPCPCCGNHENIYCGFVPNFNQGLKCRDCGLNISRTLPTRWPRGLHRGHNSKESVKNLELFTLGKAILAWNRRVSHADIGLSVEIIGGVVAAMYYRFRKSKINRAVVSKNGLFVADFSRAGKLLGIEMLGPCPEADFDKSLAEIGVDHDHRLLIWNATPRSLFTEV